MQTTGHSCTGFPRLMRISSRADVRRGLYGRREAVVSPMSASGTSATCGAARTTTADSYKSDTVAASERLRSRVVGHRHDVDLLDAAGVGEADDALDEGDQILRRDHPAALVRGCGDDAVLDSDGADVAGIEAGDGDAVGAQILAQRVGHAAQAELGGGIG